MTFLLASWLFRQLYRLYYWLFLFPFVCILWTNLCAALTILASFVSGQAALGVGRPWARWIAWCTPMRVRSVGLEHIDANQSYVIVVNHQSLLDVVALYTSLPIDFRWVIKQELRKIPLFGAGCARMGHVFVDRSNREKALSSLHAVQEKLVGGTSIIFFPEGTRGEGDELLPFKKGAFHMALDLHLPLLPITVRDTGKILPARAWEAQGPGDVEMIIHPPISVEGKDIEDLPQLMEQARAVIQSGLSMRLESINS